MISDYNLLIYIPNDQSYLAGELIEIIINGIITPPIEDASVS